MIKRLDYGAPKIVDFQGFDEGKGYLKIHKGYHKIRDRLPQSPQWDTTKSTTKNDWRKIFHIFAKVVLSDCNLINRNMEVKYEEIN